MKRDHKVSEGQWRETDHKRPQRRSTDRTNTAQRIKRLMLLLAAVVVFATLWQTYPAECRGFSSSTSLHCVD